MKKQLNVDAVVNELKDSAFFRGAVSQSEAKKEVKQETTPKEETKKVERKSNNDTVIPRHHDTMVSRNNDDIIETIRKAVKQLGKEAATYRFTDEEKRALSDIVYQYRGQGIRTSENEITRTAINFLVEDYQRNGKNSVLAQVIERLNA